MVEIEFVLLGAFSLALIGCVGFGVSVVAALLFGFVLFFCYGLRRGRSAREMLGFAVSGVRTVAGVLVTMLLVGVVTALWRAGGTIPFIVCAAAGACLPSVMLLMTFLICCGVSMLLGTSLGTAATVGVICMTMGNALGVPDAYMGGAVLAGVYFGDRCSPMSTSALLVCELTGTDIYRNLVHMLRSAAVPFAASALFYFLLGLRCGGDAPGADVRALFGAHFTLSLWTLLPALSILVTSLLRLNVRLGMGVSIALAAAVAVWVQGVPVSALPRIALLGFQPADAGLAALLAGGGAASMLHVVAVVLLSSSYSGMFRGTGFLARIQRGIGAVSRRAGRFAAVLLAAIVTSVVSCNQTLATILTHQLCGGVYADPEREALDLENSVIVVAAVIPWSIACVTPLASVGAPLGSIPFAVYLFALPLWSLWRDRRRQRAEKEA